MKRSTLKIVFVNLLTIICSAAFAIAVHIILSPSADADVGKFDSVFVKIFSFPAVAVGYFLILYTQCTFAVSYICKRTRVSSLKIGIYSGLAFAMVYLFAMQEVIVESSPFTTYGFHFIKYQFFMGLGDAIPVFVLCLVVALFSKRNDDIEVHYVQGIKKKESILVVGIIAIGFIIERTVGYETGIIHSNIDKYTIPCYIWTVLFGIVLGCIYLILYPLLFNEGKRAYIPVHFVLIIGINWIVFNSFIGLIMKGAMAEMLLRSGLDVIILFIASFIIEKRFAKVYTENYIGHREDRNA